MFEEILDGASNSTIQPHEDASNVGYSFSALVGHHMIGPRSLNKVNKSWTLGLQSQAHPRDIMSEVFRALHNLEVCWKKIGDYNMKCRWVHKFNILKEKFDRNEEECAIVSPNVLKFELQLYKVRDGKYLLDIQRGSGPQFIFFNLCVALLTELRVL